MRTANTDVEGATSDMPVRNVDLNLEVVDIPVSDADRARDFCVRLGWRIDADIDRDDWYAEFMVAEQTGKELPS